VSWILIAKTVFRQLAVFKFARQLLVRLMVLFKFLRRLVVKCFDFSDTSQHLC